MRERSKAAYMISSVAEQYGDRVVEVRRCKTGNHGRVLVA